MIFQTLITCNARLPLSIRIVLILKHWGLFLCRRLSADYTKKMRCVKIPFNAISNQRVRVRCFGDRWETYWSVTINWTSPIWEAWSAHHLSTLSCWVIAGAMGFPTGNRLNITDFLSMIGYCVWYLSWATTLHEKNSIGLSIPNLITCPRRWELFTLTLVTATGFTVAMCLMIWKPYPTVYLILIRFIWTTFTIYILTSDTVSRLLMD